MLLSAFIREGTAALETIYPSPEARGMVLMLCEERLGVKSYTHIIEPGTEVPEAMLPGLESEIGRLAAGEPVQYVLGFSEFRGRRFKVSPSVLIPRPETEELVAMAVGHLRSLDRPARVLDLCTGSGCIAWSLSLDVPGCRVDALDISPGALEIARMQFPGETAPAFHLADVLQDSSMKDFMPGYDLVLSNPPYVMESEKSSMRANVLDHEPGLALFVPDSDPLLFYRAVARWSRGLLAPGGLGMVEINEALGHETSDVFKDSGFRDVTEVPDIYGKARFVRFTK